MPGQADLQGRLRPGYVLGGRYRIDRLLGAGGMGTVYAARELAGDRPVALKVIGDEHTADQQTVARFQREGQVMSQTRHPNIVEVLEVGQADGCWFLAMELLEGTNLADAITAKGHFDTAEAVPILAGVLEALTAAHGGDVVHRDLKPENVFLCGPPGGAPRAKVLDFGVAKVVGKSAHDQLTRSGTVVGTPEFMSPEQAMGTSVDGRSDLYAVGCIAYAMLCGRPPFLDDWPMRVVMKQAFEPPVPPSRVRPELSRAEAVDRFMARALAKRPEDRFQSAGEMSAALDALGTRPPQA
jgi:eukaryotic-like serine/threonine-protein kinase